MPVATEIFRAGVRDEIDIPTPFVEAFKDSRILQEPFRPKIVERFIPENVPVGWVGSRPVIRPIIGREFVGIIDVKGEEHVVFNIYVHASGGIKDYPLFLITEPHYGGWTGIEGFASRVVPRQEAERLIFSA